MEGKSSRWADWSDEDCSNDEENPAIGDQNPEPLKAEHPQEVTVQNSKLDSQTPPYTLKITNVPYKVRDESEIKAFFGLTSEQMDQVKVKMIMGDRGFTGHVYLTIDQKDLALKLMGKNGADFLGRIIYVYVPNANISYMNERGNNKRDYENQRKSGYNDTRNHYNGERRQYDQENRNQRTDNKKKYIKKESPVIKESQVIKESPVIKTSQKITIAPDPLNKPHPQKIAIASEPQSNSKSQGKIEERKYPEETTYNLKSIEKTSEVKPTIASDEIQKPKSNPFASAKPIDTTQRDLIFEEKAKAEKSKALEDETYHIRKISTKKNEEECVPEKAAEVEVEVERDQERKNSSENGNNREDYFPRRPYRGRNFNSRGSARGGYDGRYRRKEYID